MKVIIAGSRYMSPSADTIYQYLADAGWIPTEIVCGGAKGVDTAGKRWADAEMIPVTYFHADWERDGKAAGPKRNTRMADYGDALLLIWDGKSRGSASMKREAEKRGLPIHEKVRQP